MTFFTIGNRYRFQCSTGEYVGTFNGTRLGKLKFVDVTKIIDTEHVPGVFEVLDDTIYDAEQWNSSMPFADTGFVNIAKKAVKRAAKRKLVYVKFANAVQA